MPSSHCKKLNSQIPTAQILIALGYQYLTPAQALEQLRGRLRQVVLSHVLDAWLHTHNHFP